jgi:hypothetical protein
MGQWVNCFDDHGDQFKIVDDLINGPFPRQSAVYGKTSRFAWWGECNRAIEVRLTDDNSRPPFWIHLNVLLDFSDFSSDPRGSFQERVVRERSGNYAEREFVVGKAHCWEQTFAMPSGSGREILWSFYSSDDQPRNQPDHWVLATFDGTKARTFITNVVVLRRAPTTRLVPLLPKDIPAAHADVKDIERVGVFEYTGLGSWNRDRVQYLSSQDVLQVLREKSVRLSVSAVVVLLLTFVLLKRHTAFERSLQ